jgi:biopolymer transport protein ExbD
MAVNTNTDEEMIVGINVTPLVDVVLVLLVIFMITAPVIYQSTIKVELPRASSGEKTEHITLRFTLMGNGDTMLGSDKVSRDRVPELVKSALKQDPTANAVIAADRNLTHGTVITFIDLLKTNGLQRFGIAVDSGGADGKTK